MNIDRVQLKKIIEQQISPNENIIVWTDEYIKGILKTYNEQVLEYGIDPDLAKTRIIAYITQRLQTELK